MSPERRIHLCIEVHWRSVMINMHEDTLVPTMYTDKDVFFFLGTSMGCRRTANYTILAWFNLMLFWGLSVCPRKACSTHKVGVYSYVGSHNVGDVSTHTHTCTHTHIHTYTHTHIHTYTHTHIHTYTHTHIHTYTHTHTLYGWWW